MYEPRFVAFETGSAKWIEFCEGGPRFHSSIQNATRLSNTETEEQNFSKLLAKFEIDWLAPTIEIHYE